jgi:hypothetical protein
VDEGGSEGEEAPSDHCAWEVYPRWEVLKREIVRDLAKEIATVEYYKISVRPGFCRVANNPTCVNDVELLAKHLEIFLHTRDVGIV